VPIYGRCSSSSRQKNGEEARLGLDGGSLEAHLGQLGDDLVAVIGCGASEEPGDAAGGVNVDAARS
jgi:hypothetical protein